MSDSTETISRKATKEKMKSDSRENSCSRKKSKPNSDGDIQSQNVNIGDSKSTRKMVELETDSVVLQRRQKQIDYGKNTVGYHNYLQKVPIDKRTKEQPKTPDKYLKYSRRSWDTLIKMWRKKLHDYDDSNSGNGHYDDSDSPQESVEDNLE